MSLQDQLANKKNKLKKAVTRVTDISGRVTVNEVEQEDQCAGLIVSNIPLKENDSSDINIEISITGESETELQQRARWMMGRNRIGDGFVCGKEDGVRVGVLVLKKEKHESHYDQIAFLLHKTCRVSQLDATEINNGALNNFDVLILPGASIFEQFPHVKAIHPTLAKWVHQAGGGIVGMCSGAFSVSANGFSDCKPSLGMANLMTSWTEGVGVARVKPTDHGRELFGDVIPPRMYFANGPHFSISINDNHFEHKGMKLKRGDITPLMIYEEVNTNIQPHRTEFFGYDIAVFHATFGKGQIICFGPHPEVSEGWQDAYRNAIYCVAMK